MPTPAHRWVRRNPIIALGFIVLFCFYGEDIQSCRRTQFTRQTQATNVPILRELVAHKHPAAARRLVNPKIPDCFPFPGA